MRLKLLIALVLLISTLNAADTATPLPNQVVEETSKKILEIINMGAKKQIDSKEMESRVHEVLLPVVDLNAFSKLILSHNWRKASPEQQQRFIQEFKGMLFRTYTKYLVDYSGTKVSLIPKEVSQKDPKRRVVFTEVILPGKPPLAVDYGFWLKDGKWKAYNVTVDGLSLVHLFRTEYTREINETSLDALIERLSKANLDRTVETDERDRSVR